MTKIEFKNLPDTSTPLSAENLNTMQDNIEDAIDNVSIDLDDEVSTTSTNGIENQAITNYVDGEIQDTKDYVDSEVATKQDILTTTHGTGNIDISTTNVEKNDFIKYGKIVDIELVLTVTNQISNWSDIKVASGYPEIDVNYTNSRSEFYAFADGLQIRCAIKGTNLYIFYNNQAIPADTQIRFYTTYISKD